MNKKGFLGMLILGFVVTIVIIAVILWAIDNPKEAVVAGIGIGKKVVAEITWIARFVTGVVKAVGENMSTANVVLNATNVTG